MNEQQQPNNCVHGKLCTDLNNYIRSILPSGKYAIQKCLDVRGEGCPHYHSSTPALSGYIITEEELTELALYFREHKYPQIAKRGGAIISQASSRQCSSSLLSDQDTKYYFDSGWRKGYEQALRDKGEVPS